MHDALLMVELYAVVNLLVTVQSSKTTLENNIIQKVYGKTMDPVVELVTTVQNQSKWRWILLLGLKSLWQVWMTPAKLDSDLFWEITYPVILQHKKLILRYPRNQNLPWDIPG